MDFFLSSKPIFSNAFSTEEISETVATGARLVAAFGSVLSVSDFLADMLGDPL
jgi:hypothetical protein